MFKLIVSDMDGTLLNNQQQISDKTKKVLKKLPEKGTVFSAASGRSRRSLSELFGDIPFASISDNGATLYDQNNNLIWYQDISFEKILPLWQIVQKHSFLHPVFCGLKKHYVLESDTEEAKKVASHFFNGHVIVVKSIQDVYDNDVVVKLSLHTRQDGADEEKSLKILEGFQEQFTITLSGGGWVDIVSDKASKGIAYEKLCRHFGYLPDETMMFGDYLNDLEMLKRCPNSWCMKNGHPDVKKICAHITEYTNDEDGVAREVAKIVGLDDVGMN